MESPLDVLSRAATMLKDGVSPHYDEVRSCVTKELPSTRWRRDRRCREKMGEHGSKQHRTSHQHDKHDSLQRPTCSEGAISPAPLDMTMRGRAPRPPPPYSQCVVPSARPSVITCARGHRRELISGGMCDPVIDEHFRRSLGNDYMSLFSSPDTHHDTSVTVTGLSVDDHFAKALGDTWVKLQTKCEDVERTKTAQSAVEPMSAAAATTTTAPKPATTSSASLVQQRRSLLSIH